MRIEPWIYTHKFPINTYRHFDSPLGYNLPPNSEKYGGIFRQRFSKFVEFKLGLERIRHGANSVDESGIVRNVGGSLHYGWRPGDERENKKWLSGVLHEWSTLTLIVSWNPLPNVFVASGYKKVWTERSAEINNGVDHSYLSTLNSGWYIDARWGLF